MLRGCQISYQLLAAITPRRGTSPLPEISPLQNPQVYQQYKRSKHRAPSTITLCYLDDPLKALLSAQLRQNDYPNIFHVCDKLHLSLNSFRGIKSQSKASLFAEMSNIVGLSGNSGLLKFLEEASKTVKGSLSDFSFLAREVNLQLSCFFEEHESDTMDLSFRKSHLKHKFQISNYVQSS